MRKALQLLATLAATCAVSHDAIAQDAVLQHRFESGTDGWIAFGDGARVDLAREAQSPSGGKAALQYDYPIGKGRVSMLLLPISPGKLAGTGSLQFLINASAESTLIVTLEEQGGGRWNASIAVPRNEWRRIELDRSDFVLSQGKGDPADDNGRLDFERVKQLGILDAIVFLMQGDPNAVSRMFGVTQDPRRLLLDDFLASRATLADSATAGDGGLVLDSFNRAQPVWMAFGPGRITRSTDGPLSGNALEASFRLKSGTALSLMKPVATGTLAGSTGISFNAASEQKTILLVKLEQQDGRKYEATVELNGKRESRAFDLPYAGFKPASDSRPRGGTPDPGSINQIVLLQLGGLGAPVGDNILWVNQVTAVGAGVGTRAARSAAMPSTAKSTEKVAMIAVDSAGWARWEKRAKPIHSGPFSLVGDPSVFKDGSVYRMFYNCFDPKRKGPAVCQATSDEGYSWTDVPVDDPVAGRMIRTRPGKWDDTHETPFALKYKGEYLLFFSGYRNKGGFFKSFPAYVGLATSKDGIHFERVSDEPIIKTTPGWYDNDAVFSPSIIEDDGKLLMLYTGHCWNNCSLGKGVFLLTATSTDGRNWTKHDKPVMTKADLPWSKDGAAEAELVKGPDGYYYLFMGILFGDDGHDIGIARSASPFGPWEINRTAIIQRTKGNFDAKGPIAPSILIEGDRVRMWYHGFSERKTIEIGYAEAPWPLKLK